MEKPLKNIKETAKALFSEGYLQAAAAFATLSGKKVNVGSQEIQFNSPDGLLKKLASNQELSFLVTEVIGDAHGRSYLILNKYEVEKLLALMLLKLKNFESNKQFEETILKELDNVLAASVITQLSNFLNLNIYGDVPSLIRPAENTKSWLSREFERTKSNTTILSSVYFTFEDDVRLQPSFVWMLDENFYRILNQKAESYENSQAL